MQVHFLIHKLHTVFTATEHFQMREWFKLLIMCFYVLINNFIAVEKKRLFY